MQGIAASGGQRSALCARFAIFLQREPTFGVEDVHHGADHVDAVLEREVDKVGVDDDAVRRHEGLIVREEERSRHGVTGSIRTVSGTVGQRRLHRHLTRVRGGTLTLG